MLIRPAQKIDILALQALLRASWLTTWAPHLKPETVARFREIDDAGTYAATCWRDFVVAEENGALRGMFHIDANHLNAIHLDPMHKRRGIGTFLMDEVERRIAAHNREASLEVLVFNTAAISFYAGRGWTHRGGAYETLECGEPVDTYTMIKSFPA
jgi:ribosomal protein S18 acetylase RimI-like enzyme